jgi:hypothetical protein
MVQPAHVDVVVLTVLFNSVTLECLSAPHQWWQPSGGMWWLLCRLCMLLGRDGGGGGVHKFRLVRHMPTCVCVTFVRLHKAR